MTVFADRVTEVGPAAPFLISKLVTEARADGVDVIDLGVGQPDFPVPENIIEASHDALDAGQTGYTASKGIPALRSAAADYLNRRHRLAYDPEHIIATPGGKHALYVTIQSLVERGDEVILLNPSWSSYDPMVTLAGGRSSHVDLTPYDFRLEPAIDDVAEAVTNDTAMILVNSPSNPSGRVFTDEALRGVRDIAVDHDISVISDEIYKEFIYEGGQQSLAAYDGMFERTITINGVSKAFCMTGYRLGFLAAPSDIIEQVGKAHVHSVSCASSISQHAGVEALLNTDVDEHIGEMMQVYERRRDAFVETCADIDVEVPLPEGAFYAMLPVAADDDMQWAKEAVRKAGVGTVPGSAFFSPGFVRVALTQSEELLVEAVDRLSSAGML